MTIDRMEQRVLDELVDQLRDIVTVRDRTHGVPKRHYEKCFVGAEAVVSMLDNGLAATAEEAVEIGNLLLDAGYIRHVLGEHRFEDEYLFYRFVSDEGRGQVARGPDGRRASWGELLPGLGTSSDRQSLQPTLPARDRKLGEFAQVALEEIGVAPLDRHNVELLDHVHPSKWIDPTPVPRYNLVVIGAGAGGLVTSAGSAGIGAKVALVEAHLLGGDCLNVGCVPSKALLKSAKVAQAVRRAGEFGIHINGEPIVDFGAVMERMRRLRAQIAPIDSAGRYSDELGVDVFMGRARFSGPDSVTVNGKTLRFKKAVIATGGTAAIPDIEGLASLPYLTNANVFNLTELPKRLCVVGAGPIGIELAQAFNAFGSEVTVVARGADILRREDEDAALLLRSVMEREGVRFELNAECRSFRITGDNGREVELALGDPDRVLRFDKVLVATGRKPAVSGLGLEEAGIDFDPRNGVLVDDRLQTSNPNVYAIGDVASSYQFTHVADFMARIAIRNALFLGREKASRLLIPWATYTNPEIAHVGLYPRDLEERGIAYDTYRRDFGDVDRAVLDGEEEGFVKIHVKAGTDEILGATIIGNHAGDMISELTLAMYKKVGLGEIANVIHPYPTAAEAIRQCGDAYQRTRLSPTLKKILSRFLRFQL